MTTFSRRAVRAALLVGFAGTTLAAFQNCGSFLGDEMAAKSPALDAAIEKVSAADDPESGVANFYPRLLLNLKDDYDISPNRTSTNTATYLQKAINDAIASGKATRIEVPAGTYYLNCTEDSEKTCLTINKATNLQIEGIGGRAFFVIKNPRAGFVRVTHSSNIFFGNLDISYQTPTSSEGVITAKGPNYVVVQAPAGEILPTNTAIYNAASTVGSFGMVFNGADLSVRDPIYNAFTAITFAQIDAHSYRAMIPPAALNSIMIGDRFAYGLRASGHLFNIGATENVGLRFVIVHGAPGAATIWDQMSGKVVLNHFFTRRSPGRVLTSSADAVWTMDSSAQFIIKDSGFEGMGDDAINFHSSKNVNFALSEAEPNSRVIDNNFGTGRFILRIRSPKAVISGNSFANPGNAQVVLDEDLSSDEGPQLSGADRPVFENNTVAGGSLRYVSPVGQTLGYLN